MFTDDTATQLSVDAWIPAPGPTEAPLDTHSGEPA
jgi:hypothetical protein